MDIIEIVKAIILGVVEGITEWLPVSSTGHLIIIDELISLGVRGMDSEFVAQFVEMFNVVIQLGAILAVVFLLRDSIAEALRDVNTKKTANKS